MASGSTLGQAMGELEIIDKHGVRATFTDNGIEVDLIPDIERCYYCNDARFYTQHGYKECVSCGCINGAV
jgi:hypothetical protein